MKKLSDKQLRKLYRVHYEEKTINGITYTSSGVYDYKLTLWEKFKLYIEKFKKVDKSLMETDLERL